MHRGPDAQNTYKYENVILHHLRLSILDIATGTQPMHLNEDFSIIFNGEIYNHQAIREKYHLKGVTNSDTETILLAWQKLGAKCLDEFDGMFAFALLDKKNKKVYLVRDRAGKKPLYIYNRNNVLIFTSELNALYRAVPLSINENHIGLYLRMGSFFREQTPYNDVMELTNGQMAEYCLNNNTLEFRNWWQIEAFYNCKSHLSESDTLAKIDELLDKAVKSRIDSSDLEVGAFLSGGIDSGLVVAKAARYVDDLKTFTVRFSGLYDESELALSVAKKFKTRHTVLDIDLSNLKYDIEKILHNYGEPFFDSSAIPSYYVSKSAKEHVTVVLNGDGADELFGGYRRFVPFAKYDFFSAPKRLKLFSNGLSKLLPPAHTKQSKYNYLHRLVSLIGKPVDEMFLASTVDIFEGYLNGLNKQYLEHGTQTLSHFIRSRFNKNQTGLQKLMLLDFDINLFDDLLVKIDIATMAHSLEGRSPFLSKEFLEFAPTISDKLKIHNTTTKVLLRKLAERTLPPEIAIQPKRGFEVPLKKWVNNDLKEVIYDNIMSSDAYHSQYVNKPFFEKLLNKKLSISEEKRAKMIWTIYSLDNWYKRLK